MQESIMQDWDIDMIKILFVAFFLFIFYGVSNAQFIVVPSGGVSNPNYIQDDSGHQLNDDAGHFLLAG